MRATTKQLLRENLLGISLTLIGVLCLALAAITYLGHRDNPYFALADGQALDGPEIEALERDNKAYEIYYKQRR